MRKSLVFVALGTCFVLALTANAAVPAEQGSAAQPAPTAAVAPATVPAPASGLCLQGAELQPVFQAGGRTCEDCTANCDAQAQRCYDHCTLPRGCDIQCDGDYFTCIDKCPC